MNVVILVGNLGKDPEVRKTQTGKAVCSFSLATKERDDVNWHNIVAWEKTAELCGKYLKKGSAVGVQGMIQTRSYDDKNGVKKYITEIVANRVKFLGRKADGESANQAADEADIPF